MERMEFAKVLAYLSAGTGKEITLPQAEVYYDLLHDLPGEAVWFGAKRALIESQYPTLPPIGKLREFALAFVQGEDGLSAEAAYGLVRKAITKHGLMGAGRASKSLPEIVWLAVDAIGWGYMCNSESPDCLRAHFFRTFEAIAGRQKSLAKLPASMLAEIKQIGKMPRDRGAKETSLLERKTG